MHRSLHVPVQFSCHAKYEHSHVDHLSCAACTAGMSFDCLHGKSLHCSAGHAYLEDSTFVLLFEHPTVEGALSQLPAVTLLFVLHLHAKVALVAIRHFSSYYYCSNV